MPGRGIELAATYVSVIPSARGFKEEAARGIGEAQRYADSHPINIKAKIDVNNLRAIEIPVVANSANVEQSVRNSIRIAQSYADTHAVNIRTDIDSSGISRKIDAALERASTGTRAVPINVSTDVDSANLSRKIDEAVAQASVGTHSAHINIATDLDAIRVREQIEAAVAAASTGTLDVRVGLRPDTARLRTELRGLDAPVDVSLRTTAAEISRFSTDLNGRLASRRITAQITPTIDQAALRERLANLPEGTIKVKLAVSDAEIRRFAAELQARLRGFDLVVPVGLDLENEAAFRARLDALLHRRTVDVNVNVDRSAAGHISALATGLGSIGSAAGGVTSAAAKIALIGGAAGAALGAVGALSAGILALGTAAGAVGITAAIGIHGIADAFKALGASSDSAGADATAKTQAIAAATKQLDQANKEVASSNRDVLAAERDVARAKEDSRTAEQDLTRARKDAQQQIEDLNQSLRAGSLSEKDAQLSLAEARRDLAQLFVKNPQADALDQQRAILRVQEAEERLTEAQTHNQRLAGEAVESNRKGIEGSDGVVAAKLKVRDASEKVTESEQKLSDAQDKVVEAQKSVAEAQKNLADAMNKTSSASDKAAAAMAKLSPNAQAFVRAMRSLGPEWERFRKGVQDNLFAGLDTSFTNLAHVTIPTLSAGMGAVATAMNGAAKAAASFWSTPTAQAGMLAGFKGTADAINAMKPGMAQAAQGFVDFSAAAGPALGNVGKGFGTLMGQIGQAFSAAALQGSLGAAISSFGDILAGLGQGLNPLIQSLIQVGAIVGPVIGPFLTQLGQSLANIMPSLAQLGVTFLTALQPILPVLADFIKALAQGLQPILPIIAQLISALLPAIQPLIGPLSQITQAVGTALVQAVTALAPAIGPLGTAFASIITALAPVIPVIAQVVSGLVQALAPALTTIANALAPVIKILADALMPVFQQMQPILAQVALQLGTAIADALTKLAPYIPELAKNFGDLVIALLPLLPQLGDLVVKILPPMIDLLIAILPQINEFIKALTWLAEKVVPVLNLAMQGLAQYISDTFNHATTAINTARDIIGSALHGMGDFFTDLGHTVKGVWDGIVHAIAVSVKTVGELLQKVPNVHIPGTNVDLGAGVSAVGDVLVAWSVSHGAATGGMVTGPGSPTSDSILARLSDGEYVVNAASTARALPLLEAINAGWVPPADFLHAMIPGFAGGGLVPGLDFALSMNHAKYQMGGFSRQSIDCSGMVSATVNAALGRDPFSDRMSTPVEGNWLAARGAVNGRGAPGDIMIGWFDHGGGANGHTAMTLSDGTNVESNGSDGVVIGGKVGGHDPMFDHNMYIPAKLLRGGDLGGPAGTSGAGALGGAGATGGGTGAGGANGGASSSAAGATGQNANGATPVFVTNWPGSTQSPAGIGGPTAQGLPSPQPSVSATPEVSLTPGGAVGADLATTAGTPGQVLQGGHPELGIDANALRAQVPLNAGPAGAGGGQHPLAAATSNLPGPLGKLFQGPAPWYLAATPEQALTNLGTQAAGLAQKTGTGFVDLIQNNWKEMLNTGLAVAGMGVSGGGGGGPQMVVHNTGMDPNSAAAAVERVWRRRTLANQRGGGFGR